MKKINQLLLAVLLGGLGVLCFVNLLLSQTEFSGNDREYRISLNRLEQSVEDFEKETGRAAESLEELAAFAKAEKYPFVTGLSVLARESEEGQESEAFWRNGESEYAVIAARLAYYKVYYVSGKISDGSVRVLVNSLAVFFLLLTLSVLWLSLIHI